MRHETIMEYIFNRMRCNDNGCWEFTGRLNTMGYGQIVYQGKFQLIHRISWRLNKGKIPNGLFVLHRCDNPLCFNPDHLFLGTQQDNLSDMRAKGRDYKVGRDYKGVPLDIKVNRRI
jgi:hypothetical protein